jgi:hypothetical protein
MALEMKTQCAGCAGFLGLRSEAFICTYECTFCPACTETLLSSCPNCGGELVRRPRRKVAVIVLDPNESTQAQLTVGEEPA